MKKIFAKSLVFILVISHSLAQFAHAAGAQRTVAKPGTKINDQTTTASAKKADPELTNKISATFQGKFNANPDVVAKITDPSVLSSLKSFFGTEKIKSKISERSSQIHEVELESNRLLEISGLISARTEVNPSASSKSEGLVDALLTLPKIVLFGTEALSKAGLEASKAERAIKELSDLLKNQDSSAKLEQIAEAWFKALQDKGLVDKNANFKDWIDQLRQCLASLL